MPQATDTVQTSPDMASFIAAWETTAIAQESAVDGARVAMMPFVSMDRGAFGAGRIYFAHEDVTTQLLVAGSGIDGDELDLKVAFERAIRS